MRINVPVIAASLLLIVSSSAQTPQTPTSTTSSSQATSTLAQSVKALTGSAKVGDVTFTGTAEWIAGSDDETGTATYRALSGAYRLDMAFRNGERSEMVSPIGGAPTGSWIGIDGISHAMANQNMMVDAGWFPLFTLSSLISSPNTTLTFFGQETRNGVSVIHISSSQSFPSLSGDDANLMQHLTQVDIYLDPTTFLPVSYVYNSHPDINIRPDIPTEIRYSDYRMSAGTQVPFHVRKFINNSLVIDLQFQNVILNSGLNTQQLAAQ